MINPEKLEDLTVAISDTGYYIWDDFLPLVPLQEVIGACYKNEDTGAFKDAGIGKQVLFQIDKSIRGDKVKWINKEDKNSGVQYYLQAIQRIIEYINRTCFIGIKDFELHFAIYPENTFYKRHKDRFKNSAHRIITFILYLNENWQEADGGTLKLYLDNQEYVVEPLANRLLVFRSELEHEVLLSNAKRASITGWMLDKDMSLTFLP